MDGEWLSFAPLNAPNARCAASEAAGVPVRNSQFVLALCSAAYSLSLAGVSTSGSIEIDTRRTAFCRPPSVASRCEKPALITGQIVVHDVKMKFTSTGASPASASRSETGLPAWSTSGMSPICGCVSMTRAGFDLGGVAAAAR